jgi:hypothetical protein
MAISQSQNNLGWLLATCPDNSLRNGKKAVELAQQTVQLSGANLRRFWTHWRRRMPKPDDFLKRSKRPNGR